MARNWAKNRNRELTRLGRSQGREEAALVARFDRRPPSRTLSLLCYSCGHSAAMPLADVRTGMRLRCRNCGDVQVL